MQKTSVQIISVYSVAGLILNHMHNNILHQSWDFQCVYVFVTLLLVKFWFVNAYNRFSSCYFVASNSSLVDVIFIKVVVYFFKFILRVKVRFVQFFFNYWIAIIRSALTSPISNLKIQFIGISWLIKKITSRTVIT